MTKRVLLVAAAPILLLVAGCGPHDAQTSIGAAASTASASPAAATASSSTTRAPASPDATPDHPIVDSAQAQSVCSQHAYPGAKLLAAYDTSIVDVVSWQENDPEVRSVSMWRAYPGSEAVRVCYYQGSFDMSCPGPPPGQPPCPPATRMSMIIAADGTARPYAMSDDSLSLTRPPHLNGPLGPPPTPQAGPPPPTPVS